MNAAHARLHTASRRRPRHTGAIAIADRGDVGHTERDRLVAAAGGDRGALRWLLDEIAPVVYGFVFARVGGNQPAAEDIVQDTLVESLRGAANFRGEAALSSWMCAIARRRLARFYEAERRAEATEAGLRLVAEESHPDGLDVLATRDEVIRALGALPALHRQVLVLKYLDELSVEEIAEQLDRTRVQVQSLLQRARDGLRRHLTDGGDLTDGGHPDIGGRNRGPGA